MPRRAQLFLFVLWFSPVVTFAQEEVLLPEESDRAPLLVTYANEILSYTPILAGVFSALLCIALHYSACRRAARHWRGSSGGWARYWGMSTWLALAVYLLLCGSVLAYCFVASAEFGAHARANLGVFAAVLWLFVGTAIALSPMLAKSAVR
jgi:hypothetical protein